MTAKPTVYVLGHVDGSSGVWVETPEGFTLTEAIADQLRAVVAGATVPAPIVAAETPFELFWRAYPRKVAKVLAAKAWRRLNPTPALTAQIMAALGRQKRTEQWTKDGGQFVPHAATWLNQQRWLDEIGPSAPLLPSAEAERARSVDVIRQRAALLRGARA